MKAELRKAVRRYIFYTLGLSVLLTIPRVLLHPRHLTRMAVSCAAMWVPALGAWIVTCRYPGVSLQYGIKKCLPRYVLASLLIPIGYLGASFIVCFSRLPSPVMGWHMLGAAGLIVLELFRAAGEEIGWRGFLYPALEQLYGLRRGLLLGGLVWAVWHYPLILGGLYLTGTPRWWSIPIFTVEILSMGVILAWLCHRSDSLLPAIVMHAAHNYMLPLLIASAKNWSGWAYRFGEQGMMTAAMTAGIAGLLLAFGWNDDRKLKRTENGTRGIKN